MEEDLGLFPVLLDKLGERLVFEKISTGLFDSLCRKRQLFSSKSFPLEILVRFLDEELAHVRLLERNIRLFGGNLMCQSASASLISQASLGFQKVVLNSEIPFLESLEAMLIAEQTDNFGWGLLVGISERIGLEELAWELKGALDQEQVHLATFHDWVLEARTHGKVTRIA